MRFHEASLVDSADAPRPGSGLSRTLGPFLLTFSGLGIILGAGIYSVIGVAAGLAGESLWLAFSASAVVACLTALSYAELATTYPRAGAEFTYVEHSLPEVPSLAVTVGVLVAFSGVATAAAVSLAFGGYLARFIDAPPLLSACVLLAVATGINVVGTRQTATVTALFTLIEMSGLVAVIVLGARTPAFGEALGAMPSAGFAEATALVFFSFLGFENIANLAEEAKDPGRDLPIAIFVSLALACLLYVLVALAVVALASPAALASSDAPLMTAVTAHSPRVAGALGGIAMFATANTALASILVASRVIFGMAREKQLPSALGKVLARRKTPFVATILVGGASLALLPLGRVEIVASVSSFAALLGFVCVDAALVALRVRDPDRPRPFRVPLSIRGVPVLPIIGIIASLLLMSQLDVRALLIGTGTAASVFVLHAIARRRASRAAP